jgi:hypothetical protein
MRGWDGGSGQDWETVGNARKLAAFKKWVKKGRMSPEWEESLGKDFVAEMTSKKWATYTCPECSAYV